MIAVSNIGDAVDYGFGSISPNFGSTNLDSIPSSGGTAGYTSAPVVTGGKPLPGMNGSSGASAAPVINPVQSGDTNTTLDKLLALYGSQFAAPSGASTSGGSVVVVPQATGSSATTAAAGVSPQALGIVALGVVAFIGWRVWRARAGA